MDEKTLHILEYPKILERLAGYAAFSASAQMARNLRPTRRLEEAQRLQKITSEARLLLSLNSEIGVGGASDIRPLVERAARHGVLEPAELLAIKDTLISARTIARSLERKESTFPLLAEIAAPLVPPPGLIETISRVVSERGEILDSASETLARLRREVKVAFERLMTRLEHMVNDPRIAPMLQDSLITQRNGRYVIPLRAEFKGQVRSIIHDQSSSGATLFVEPLAVVDLNNEWHELQLRVRDEERRILAELSDQVGAHFEALAALTEALARFDFALACAKYAEDLRASEPVLVRYRHPARPDHPGSTIRLIQARHPLLDPQTVVPIDVDLDEDTFCVVITGPNTGGKTVTLKTVGLLALMAQSGLHIPARSGSELSVFENVFADIGDEQSIEQSLSTFSGHIKNISRILRRANTHTLVLFDELGAGTDPQEGAALARAILAHMVEKRIPCLIATHYPELKIFAHNTPGVINASMEFDLNTLRPTYHLTLGLPGRSNALAIASRLGLDPVIIEKARAEISPEELRAENLLNEIHRQRDAARRARERAEKEQREVERLRAELAARLEKIEEERQRLLEKVREEAEQEAEALRREVEEVRRQLMRARQPLEALQPLREKSEALVENARTALVSTPAAGETTLPPQHPFRAGDKVRVRSLGMQGVITALGEEDAEVQVGNLRVRARLSDLQKPGQKDAAEPAAPVKAAARGRTTLKTAAPAEVSVYYPSPGMEIDLRGQLAEDALDALERYLEAAVLAGLPFVRIIHGKGTGKLRQVIRQALDASPHVKSHSPGEDREGGEGVTIARLKVD
ncbi:endonuclease MutS2 [Anaerolinea thermophila]|uniref:Endonuclease MutS2 n=2 Tax=Anaerolinea TaxID=233189 RepID=E8N279_ANATU|nr:endonuclease MutS2 [Anaerolinea thermophila]BAJ65026.1 MutS2 family protein [Anaerolinea thermophila UNI-1]